MKTCRFFWAIGAFLVASCGLFDDTVKVKDPITISSPVPTQKITKVGLNETQSGYVDAGNAMAFKFLQQLYSDENVICSPLSLQYALAMVANGASGETLREITDFLGYGDSGIDSLNEYCKILLEQLPAVDLDVTLKVVDALLVNETCPLSPAFKEAVQNNYYAAVDNMDFKDPKYIAARVNDWAKRSTNGFVDNVVNEGEISPDALAYIMNALYFKAAWAGGDMFSKLDTKTDKFYLSDGTTCNVDLMYTIGKYKYAEMDGFKVLALPFADYRFYMYFLLPNGNNLDGLMDKLHDVSWREVNEVLTNDAIVYAKIPKFTVESKYDLSEQLQALGVVRPFIDGVAEFDRMFKADLSVYISKVIQKSKISVDENGSEAGSVTIVEMAPTASEPSEGEKPKTVRFTANRPFVYLIGERTSGTILFEGTFVNPKK